MLALQAMGHDPAVLRGGIGARTRCDPVQLAVPAWRPAAAGRGHRPLALLGDPDFDVDLEFSGGVSQAGIVDG